MKKRIWELDAFRGICILGMVLVHFVYDLVELYGIWDWRYPAWFSFAKNWGGVLFLLISGISATLGSRSVRRGLLVIVCGMIVSAVTYGMYKLGYAGRDIIIYFGVLQCLGFCMILWYGHKAMPWWALLLQGLFLAVLGLYINDQLQIGQICVQTKWLMPLGLWWDGFSSSDYFPLLPNFGYFLIGAALGRTVYAKKKSLFPNANEDAAVLRFFRFCGKHSLWIYLLHQPILSGICMLLMLLRN